MRRKMCFCIRPQVSNSGPQTKFVTLQYTIILQIPECPAQSGQGADWMIYDDFICSLLFYFISIIIPWWRVNLLLKAAKKETCSFFLYFLYFDFHLKCYLSYVYEYVIIHGMVLWSILRGSQLYIWWPATLSRSWKLSHCVLDCDTPASDDLVEFVSNRTWEATIPIVSTISNMAPWWLSL